MSEQRDEPQGEPGSQPDLETDPAATPAAAHGISTSTDLADGEWHRLHPATPLFRGGIAFIVVLGILISNFRDRAIDFFFGGDGDFDGEGDPIDFIVEQELVLVALLALMGVLLLFIAGFWLSWRMHTFRITDEVVEVRSGILFRTNRKGRLDRIQGVNVGRPFIPRLFGAAKLEVSVAGNDANVQLSYLHSRTADALRADILRLASGARREASGGAGAADGAGTAGAHDLSGMLDERVLGIPGPRARPGTRRAGGRAAHEPGSPRRLDGAERDDDRFRAAHPRPLGRHRGERRTLPLRRLPARDPRSRRLPRLAHHALAALLDRVDARRRARWIRSALDDERDSASRSHPLGARQPAPAVAAVGLVADRRQPRLALLAERRGRPAADHDPARRKPRRRAHRAEAPAARRRDRRRDARARAGAHLERPPQGRHRARGSGA
ncbi:MAG: PH domain-containing protein [Microcella pacifica]